MRIKKRYLLSLGLIGIYITWRLIETNTKQKEKLEFSTIVAGARG